MNEAIILNWNSVVTKEDMVYVLGDVIFGNNENSYNLVRRLNGNKFLIDGNHDSITPEFKALFGWVRSYYELNHDFGGEHKQKLVLCHYAFKVWNKSHYGAWNLYGHSHGSLAPVGKQIDVGIDATYKYKEWFGTDAGVKPLHPVSIDQIRELMRNREIPKFDHHGD
jgi:calcineurin-like phosphoesterase family protein